MIVYKDVAELAEVTSDGYGDTTIEDTVEISCLFLQSTGHVHANNVDGFSADAHIYLDPTHALLLDRGFRIEGMFLKVAPFGSADGREWYRIVRVVVGQRKLLDNDVDNVHAFLQRVENLT